MTDAGFQPQEPTDCSICLKAFNDPRVLPCTHTFCLECLKETANTAAKKPRGNMACPLCGQFFTIPADGLDGLQKNLFVEELMEVTTNLQQSNTPAIACDICKDLYDGNAKVKTATMCCRECGDNFCDMCAKAHTLQKLSKDHHVVGIDSKSEEEMRGVSPNRNCTVHDGVPLDYYCTRCKKIVCMSCMLEDHASHGCEDVSAVEEEFRKAIERSALKILIYTDEMLSRGRIVEERKQNILSNLAETENEIRQRNLELKEMIDNQTSILLDELSKIREKQITDCENDKEETESNYTILKSFETYCNELVSRGSAREVCSCVDEIITRANELEKDHETFTDIPSQSTEISFQAAELEDLLYTSDSNIVGKIEETSLPVESCVIVTGLSDGFTITKDVIKINLHRPDEISTEQQVPTTMANGAAADFYFNTMYITGIGISFDEIWEYNLVSGWMKCASLVQGRMRHCAVFVDEVLYNCGGYVVADGSVICSVEGYNAITNTCKTVGNLVHCVQSSGNCVPYKGSLYIFGGSDKNNTPLFHVQVYDTVRNTCTLLSKPMPNAYNLMRAALLDATVILIGSFTCFVFHIETETWQERKQFKTDVFHFGLAVANDRIFVIGGGKQEAATLTWTCRDDIRYVPIRGVIEDKPFEWKNYSKLSRPAMVQTYGKLQFSATGSI